jgi:Predicted glutamine amidotransferase
MCVILDIQPGATIPDDAFETACDINKHGYGLAFIDKGRLKIERKISEKNDPDEIAKKLKKYNKHRVFLHLRHATVGKINEANSHPFVTLKGADGLDLCMMHNGTMYEYQPPAKLVETMGISDTHWYNETFLIPLAERMVKHSGVNLLKDAFFSKLVHKSFLGWSVLLLFDNQGNVIRVNGERGKEFDGYWASNDYSFNTNHQRSSIRTYARKDPWYDDDPNKLFQTSAPYVRNHGGGALLPVSRTPIITPQDKEIWAEWDKYDTQCKLIAEQDELQRPNAGSDRLASPERRRYEIKRVSDTLKEKWKLTEKSMTKAATGVLLKLDKDRMSFATLAGIKDISEVLRLSKEDFTDLCDNFPLAMAECFVDMAAELQRCKELIKFSEAPKHPRAM